MVFTDMDAKEIIRTSIVQAAETVGYEIVDLEFIQNRPSTLRVLIDHLHPEKVESQISVEDCAKMSHVVNELLDTMTKEVDSVFHSGFDLEVSSPGLDRPLKNPKDFERFQGREIKVSTARALEPTELSNEVVFKKNPKQKTFFGTLKGFQNGRILLDANLAGSPQKKDQKKKKPGSRVKPQKLEGITIPLDLVVSARLEPNLEF